VLTGSVITLVDAVPKKRGPKTDVLEALLKRVDGLEAKLKEKKTEPLTPTAESVSVAVNSPSPTAVGNTEREGKSKLPALDTTQARDATEAPAYSPTPVR